MPTSGRSRFDPRGARTGVAGERDRAGDRARLRPVHDVGRVDQRETVRVQREPGVVQDKLNAQLRPCGRYLPPIPRRRTVTTVGGMIGVDAAGSRAIRIGSMRDYVPSLETVLSSGQVFEFEQELLPLSASPTPCGGDRRDGDRTAFRNPRLHSSSSWPGWPRCCGRTRT